MVIYFVGTNPDGPHPLIERLLDVGERLRFALAPVQDSVPVAAANLTWRIPGARRSWLSKAMPL